MSLNRSPVDLAPLRARLQGPLLTPDDHGYEAARRVWNARVDRHPAAIARCLDAADVVAGVTFAGQHDLLLAIRGGGHDVGGRGTCDDGLVLDLSPMKAIQIDPSRRTARVEPGVVWGELDAASQRHDLAVTGGQISTTGVAGLTLGGGLGWLMRESGLTIDSLLSVDVVTAGGQQLTASPSAHPDLFWALRGAGANFGVATAFEFQLRPLGEVVGGTVVHPVARARDLLELFRGLAHAAPECLTLMAYFFSLPPSSVASPATARLGPGPFAAIAVCDTGSHAEAERRLQAVRAFGPPVSDTLRPMPYTTLQSLFDVGSPPGFQNYWRSHYLQPLTAEAADAVAHFVDAMTSCLSIVLLTPMGGAVQRVPAEATAFGHRDAPLVLEILAKWSDTAEAAAHVAWADAFWTAMQPFSTGGAYANFLDEHAPTRAAYAPPIYDRLRRLKRRYDPGNLFRHNLNVPPA